jgi:exopolyphosphatase/guanosine-5'-triphosphate,3'-diphosphate pyrophosphatase
LIAEGGRDGLRPLLELATITRLGQGVDKNRRLSPEACARTLACLSDYAAEIRARGVERLAVVGTSAMRDAQGGEGFIAQARTILGVEPRVIDGQEEARLTFAGALSGLQVEGAISVFDIGGGSTEIITGEQRTKLRVIHASTSLDIGSVRLLERLVRHDPPSSEELAEVERTIHSALAFAPRIEPNSTLVGVAGTITQLAALELDLARYEATLVHGHVMHASAVRALYAKLRGLELEARRSLPGMEAARADVIVVGAAIACAVLDWSAASSLLVSDRGVRWGLAESLASDERNLTPVP